jgi:uncharacterized membrane protein
MNSWLSRLNLLVLVVSCALVTLLGRRLFRSAVRRSGTVVRDERHT